MAEWEKQIAAIHLTRPPRIEAEWEGKIGRRRLEQLRAALAAITA